MVGDKAAGPEGAPGRLFRISSNLHWRKIFLEIRSDRLVRRPIRPVGEFPGSPVVKTPCFHCRGPCSIPGWETRIPHVFSAAKKGRKKKKDLQQSRGNTVKAGNSSIGSKASCGKSMLSLSLSLCSRYPSEGWACFYLVSPASGHESPPHPQPPLLLIALQRQ